MNLLAHPELLDRLAAAYALGTLRGGARRRFESIARQSAAARAAAIAWQERLASLTELQHGERPDPAVWTRIENLVAAQRPALPPAAPAGALERLRRHLRLWQAGALAGALATVAAVMVGQGAARELEQRDAQLAQLQQQGRALAQQNAQLAAQLQAQPEIRYVAVLADDKAGPSILATFDPRHNTLTLKRVGLYQEAPDKSLQLWALPEGSAPRSLGVLGREPVVRLLAAEPQLQQAPALAISLEPQGGVPGDGGPTGPVLFKGAVLQTPL